MIVTVPSQVPYEDDCFMRAQQIAQANSSAQSDPRAYLVILFQYVLGCV